MKIRILGFEWLPTGNATLAQLRAALDKESVRRAHYLSQLLKTGNVHGWDGRFFAMADKGKYWAGLVLKIRDQKQFCQVSGKSGKIKLTAQALAEGSKMVEVNFFLINSATGKGLYQFYHHSTWLDSFSVLCKRVFDADVKLRWQEIQEQGHAEGWTAKKIKEAKKAITGTIAHSVLVRKEQFDRLVDSLQKIQQVRVSFRDDTVAVPKMDVLADAARHASFQFSYDAKGTSIADLRAGIKQVAAALMPSRMRVVGKTAGGLEEIINLSNNYDAFHEIDFDEATADLDLDLSDPTASIEASGMIARLLEVAQKPRVKSILEIPAVLE